MTISSVTLLATDPQDLYFSQFTFSSTAANLNFDQT